MGEWPSNAGTAQVKLTDVEVICWTIGFPGGQGGPRTVNLADETVEAPLGSVRTHAYIPSSDG